MFFNTILGSIQFFHYILETKREIFRLLNKNDGDVGMFKKAIFLLGLAVLSACTAKINESIIIEANSKVNKDLNTVNGNIVIGENCLIDGDLRSINGRIEIGENSEVEKVQTINGQVVLAEGAKVGESIQVINGSIKIKSGAVVQQDVSVVNGSIRIFDATIAGDVKTTNGDIFLENKARVLGNILIEGKSGDGDKRRVEIFIRNGSQVKGNIDNQGKNAQVLVYLDDNSRVEGDVIKAELIYEK